MVANPEIIRLAGYRAVDLADGLVRIEWEVPFPSQDSNLKKKELSFSASSRSNDFNRFEFGSPSWTRFELSTQGNPLYLKYFLTRSVL